MHIDIYIHVITYIHTGVEINVPPAGGGLIWTKGAVGRHKYVTRIISDWLDMLVMFNYL
jgi:hypothetical protein